MNRIILCAIAVIALASCKTKEERELEARRQFFLDSLAIERGVPIEAVRKKQAKIDKEESRSEVDKATQKILDQQLLLHMLPSPNQVRP